MNSTCVHAVRPGSPEVQGQAAWHITRACILPYHQTHALRRANPAIVLLLHTAVKHAVAHRLNCDAQGGVLMHLKARHETCLTEPTAPRPTRARCKKILSCGIRAVMHLYLQGEHVSLFDSGVTFEVHWEPF
jgi:hypothetical protein